MTGSFIIFNLDKTYFFRMYLIIHFILYDFKNISSNTFMINSLHLPCILYIYLKYMYLPISFFVIWTTRIALKYFLCVMLLFLTKTKTRGFKMHLTIRYTLRDLRKYINSVLLKGSFYSIVCQLISDTGS